MRRSTLSIDLDESEEKKSPLRMSLDKIKEQNEEVDNKKRVSLADTEIIKRQVAKIKVKKSSLLKEWSKF